MEDVYGKTLNVITVIEEPFVNNLDIDADYNTRNGKGPGVVMELLREIGKQLDIKYNIQIRKDGKWGEYVNGSWDGMVGMLERKEMDMLAGATIVREDRATVIDYSIPFMISESGILIKSPDTVEDDRAFLIITASFEWTVWIICILAILCSAFLLKLLSRPLIISSAERQLSYVETVWLVYSAFVQQEFKKLPKSFTTRTFLSFWYLVSLSLAAIFTGNMIALFAVSKQVLPFTDVQGFVAKMVSDGYNIVLQNNSASRTKFLQNSELDVYKTLWYQMTVKGRWINVTSLDDGAAEVFRNHKNVFIGPKESIQAKVLTNCNLTTIEANLDSLWFAIGFQKHSIYTDIFSEKIRILIESGFISKWINDYLMQTTIESDGLCQREIVKASPNKAIDIKHAQGAFWLFLIGSISGIIVFAMEQFHINCINKLTQKHVATTQVKRIRIVYDNLDTNAMKRWLKNCLLKTKFRINNSVANFEESVENIHFKRFSIKSTTETVNCEIINLDENSWVKRKRS